MFNFLKKKEVSLVEHQYKNLFLFLPSNWIYEKEEGDLEACYDKKSSSTLRLHIITFLMSQNKTPEGDLLKGMDNDINITTKNGYTLTNPKYVDYIENGHKIILVTWKLIDNSKEEKIMAVITYTVLSSEKDSEKEKSQINLIQKSLENAKFV